MFSAEFLEGRRVHLMNKLAKVESEANALNERIAKHIARSDESVLLNIKRGIAERIHNAVHRLATGGYGTCLRCRRDIPIARLQRMPEAELCVPCDDKIGR